MYVTLTEVLLKRGGGGGGGGNLSLGCGHVGLLLITVKSKKRRAHDILDIALFMMSQTGRHKMAAHMDIFFKLSNNEL